MRFFIDQNSRIIVHGIHTEIGRSIIQDYQNKRINIIGAVDAGKGGSWGGDGQIPIFDSVHSALTALSPDVAAICVSPKNGFAVIAESILENIQTIICFTAGIPLIDLSKIKSLLKTRDVNFIGPNSFGIITPGKFLLGSTTWAGLRKGRVGLISRSHELAYEAAHLLAENGFGISTAIGLSAFGDVGVQLLDLLQWFDQDPETNSIVLLENSLNKFEEKTWAFITDVLTKQIVAYVPKIKNPVEEKYSYTGLKENLSFQLYQSKIDEINRAGIPLVDNLVALIDFLNRY